MRIGVEWSTSGTFTLAQVYVLVNKATRRVEPFCHSGREEGYRTKIRPSIDDVPEGRGPIGTAIREGRAIYVNDYATDDRALPWRFGGAIEARRRCHSD